MLTVRKAFELYIFREISEQHSRSSLLGPEHCESPLNVFSTAFTLLLLLLLLPLLLPLLLLLRLQHVVLLCCRSGAFALLPVTHLLACRGFTEGHRAEGSTMRPYKSLSEAKGSESKLQWWWGYVFLFSVMVRTGAHSLAGLQGATTPKEPLQKINTPPWSQQRSWALQYHSPHLREPRP